ncbi:MAG: type II CRISPR RNA-guided endonuclease Cas9 [Prevotella sp.]|nr:type II CRISPR RNA-guided endonuclease Cas9 [Prevotella sp.]
MKKILGLDLGTNSIGWALVNERENENEKSSIIKLGVRVNPLTVDEQRNFEQGKSITTNADRTLKHGIRLNLHRYKMRRNALLETLKDNGFITDDTILSENNRIVFETYRSRAKAATEQVSLEEFAKILLMINKKRGYKSSRKAKSDDEGTAIDGIEIAKQLYDNDLTPGQLTLSLLKQGKRNVPEFYRSDLVLEFNRIWYFQMQFYPQFLTEELKKELENKNRNQTWAICAKPFSLVGMKRTTKREEQKLENYEWRVKCLSEKVDLEVLAIVLQDINGQINNSSGYLGNISDRSKELYFKKLTVGQYLMKKLSANPHFSLKNIVFYRQDYLDEFERLWEVQSQYHKELTPDLKHQIRDIIIFYQRPLKSQKGLISLCEFENRTIEINVEGKKKTKTIGLRVCPRSSPLFQEFKIWQVLNNIQVSGPIIPDVQKDLFGETKEYKYGKRFLYPEEKDLLFKELNYKEKLSKTEVLKLLFKNYKELDLNFKENIEGNKTNAALYNAFQIIIDITGHGEYNFSKMQADEIISIVEPVFNGLGFDTSILHFDASLEGKEFEKQSAYQLWHLLYSFAGDNSKTGQDTLIDKICERFGFDKECAKVLAAVNLQSDYGSLSAKAIRRILPHMKDGLEYSAACEYAGYRHSKRSLTKEELLNKELKDKLELLPRNSLRNPVVEKILNQMINVVNTVILTYGKPDEIRIELARELKRNAKEREEMTKAINAATTEHENYRKILQDEFGIGNPSRNDIIRYKLYLELKDNGFKTLYSNTYIPQEKLFSKEFDIEHIIPQAKLFDDSFSNKTIEVRSINIEKSNATAMDFVEGKYDEKEVNSYKVRVEELYKNGVISKTKHDKLLMKEKDIPTGFIERDLRDSQYIAKKAREILEDIVRVVVPTTGSVTDRLREDWQLVDVMKELNWQKYDKLGLTEIREDRDGRKIKHIKDWTKRNDHRHHAMDALTIAFTKQSIIQYLNNLSARSDKSSSIYAIEQKELYRDQHGKLRFYPPIPLDEFRDVAKKMLEQILVSIKAKNKVVTRNINTTKTGNGKRNKKVQLTPRGQLHNETIYGKIHQYVTKEEKVNASFNAEKIATVANQRYRLALLERLNEYGGDAKKAFTGSNSLAKKPLFLDAMHTQAVPEKVKTVTFEDVYTIHKEITPDLKLDKVIDVKIRRILEARLEEYDNNAKKAFSNLDENPIWLNKEKGISIKRVTIRGVSNAVALHDKHDHNGELILDKNGHKQPSDYVSTSNNHHVAIYCDANGNLQENVVSFYEATIRANQGMPIIDKTYRKNEGWQFLFTMKQNEYFVFPNPDTGFNPNEIDLLDPKNYHLISPNLFRVQTMSKVEYGNSVVRDYKFRHHLETNVQDNKLLKDITFKQFKSLEFAKHIVKVRVNHIGQIVSVGE